MCCESMCEWIAYQYPVCPYCGEWSELYAARRNRPSIPRPRLATVVPPQILREPIHRPRNWTPRPRN